MKTQKSFMIRTVPESQTSKRKTKENSRERRTNLSIRNMSPAADVNRDIVDIDRKKGESRFCSLLFCSD